MNSRATRAIVVSAVVMVLLFVCATFSHRSARRERPGKQSTEGWHLPAIGGTPPSTSSPTNETRFPSWFVYGKGQRRIAGRVTFRGQPVSRATVELASELTDVGVFHPAYRVTSSDGHFDFGLQPTAKFSIAASASGHAPAMMEVDLRDPLLKPEQLELRLIGCESMLFGHVSDSSGGPIASARVCLAPPRSSGCVISDQSGAYQICLTPLQSFVSVGADGYGRVYDRVESTGRAVKRDYLLTPEATVVGRVIRADSGNAVSEAVVRVEPVDTVQRFGAPAAATTDAEGRFTIRGLAGGRYRIYAYAEDFVTAQKKDLTVESGKQTGEIVLRLLSGARVSGIVTDGSYPIVGATVSLGGAGGQLTPADGITQSDGSFVLAPVMRGQARVLVRDYEVKSPQTLLIEKSNISGLRIVVENQGSVAGHVVMRNSPVAGARVTCGRIAPVFTGPDGSYIIRGLSADHYRIFAEDQAAAAAGASVDIVLSKGERRTGVDIDIKYGGIISGTVVEPNGKPIGGVLVAYNAVHINDHGGDISAADGTFRVGTLMGGDDYRPTVLMSSRNFAPLRLTDDGGQIITVKDGATEITGITIVVQRDHLGIAGTTIDDDGQPLSDVRVSAFRSDGPDTDAFNEWVDHPTTVSGADGTFTITDLDSGTFVLQARAGDGGEAVVRGVAAGQRDVVIRVQRAGGIDGSLVGFSSPPAVKATRQLPGTFQPPVFGTVEGSTFQIRGLNPGSYQVAAIGTDSDASLVEVAAGQIATVTLQGRGSTAIHGRVYDWASGAPIPGMQCAVGLRSSSGLPMWTDTTTLSSDDGTFVFENAPTGTISVGCSGTGPYYTNGRADLIATPNGDVNCDVPVVKVQPDVPFGSIGAQLLPGPIPTQVAGVTSRGPADRAGIHVGDVILTVDGSSVTKLTPTGLQVLICQRPVGSQVRLSLSRSGQAINAELVLAAP